MSTACRVDFYVLQDDTQSQNALACRLALMAWEQGFRVGVITPEQATADRLDGLMWSHPPGRFLPHARAGSAQAAQAPVIIASAGDMGSESCSVWINMASAVINVQPGIERVLEIVPAEPGQRQAAREKFRHYREQGLDPASHDIHKA